jgi:hypothetical protein
MWKNADPDPTLMGATLLAEVGCVVAVAAVRAAQEAKDVVASPRTADAVALSLVEGVAPQLQGAVVNPRPHECDQ